MRELGIPEHQIGCSDLAHGVRCAAFMSHEQAVGGNVSGRRLSVDGGGLNPDLFSRRFGPEVPSIWA